MNRTEELARLVLSGDSLRARSVMQDMLSESPCVSDWPKPESADLSVLTLAAALVDLCAERLSQCAPEWTREVGPSPEPVYLLKSAVSMRRLRTLCETQSPGPLRRRGFYAPPNFLQSA